MYKNKLEKIETVEECNFCMCGMCKFPSSSVLECEGIKMFVDIDNAILRVVSYKDHKEYKFQDFKVNVENLTMEYFSKNVLTPDLVIYLSKYVK